MAIFKRRVAKKTSEDPKVAFEDPIITKDTFEVPVFNPKPEEFEVPVFEPKPDTDK